MPPVSHDTRYLQDLVGDALSRACAAAFTAHPNDPVEYVGQWLLRYIKNAEVVGQYASEKEAQLQTRKAQLEEAAAAAAKVKTEQEARRKAVVELMQTDAEPKELLQKACNLIVDFTAAKCAYAAFVAEPEEADWTLPEDPEDPAAAESEDEPDPSPPAELTENPENTGEAETAPVEEESQEDGAPAKQRPHTLVDYSKKYLSYTAASANQDFMLTTELYRPKPPPEDDPEAKPEPAPYTFRILDERRPMVYTANAAFEPNMRFFKDFPKIGSYQACGVQSPATGEFKAIIAADTLFPESAGQALCQEDQDFVWHVSRALSQALDRIEAKSAAQSSPDTSGVNGKDVVEQLSMLITSIYHPTKLEEAPVDGEAAAAVEEAPPAAPEAETAADDAAPPAEGEGGEDPVAILRGEVKALEAQLKEASAAKTSAAEALEKARGALSAVNDTIGSMASSVLPVLRSMRVVPQATFHVLKAVLHVLAKDPQTFVNWKRMHNHFTPELFKEIASLDATQERDPARWKSARCCYKALGEDGKAKLAAEFPSSHLGILLMMWIKQFRKVARKAAASRTCNATEESLITQLDTKREELTAAEVKKKEEEEEAARRAAEEAAAAAEAAAAESAEGGAEGEEPAEEEE